MERQEFLDTLTQIGTCEDEATRRQLLTSLQDETTKLFDSNATLTETNSTLTESNERLRDANMKLFLQVGERKSDKEVIENSTGIKTKEPTKREFKSLFDEKGGLK